MSREIDALVAENIMGIRRPTLKGFKFTPRYYSTDIAAALEMAERMHEDGYELSLNYYLGKGYHAFFTKNSHMYDTVISQSAPSALSLAALKAKGVEVGVG